MAEGKKAAENILHIVAVLNRFFKRPRANEIFLFLNSRLFASSSHINTNAFVPENAIIAHALYGIEFLLLTFPQFEH